MRFRNLAIACVFVGAPLLAQPTGDVGHVIQTMPIQAVDQLSGILSDPQVSMENKRQAVRRLGTLASELDENPNVPASKLIGPLVQSLQPQSDVEGHYLLRREACDALGRFSEVEGAGSSIVGPLGNRLSDAQENEDVRIAAARALRGFKLDAASAARTLSEALNAELDRGPRPDNVRLATQLAQSLGVLKHKVAFSALMRVLGSNFPSETKSVAKRSLEAIDWQLQ